MSEKLYEVIVDVETGEVVERQLTAKEVSEREALAASTPSVSEELAAREESRLSAASKLKALGLTNDEMQAILGITLDPEPEPETVTETVTETVADIVVEEVVEPVVE